MHPQLLGRKKKGSSNPNWIHHPGLISCTHERLNLCNTFLSARNSRNSHSTKAADTALAWGKALGERCFRSSRDLTRPQLVFLVVFHLPALAGMEQAKLAVPLLSVQIVRRYQPGHKLFISPGLLRSPLRELAGKAHIQS